MYTIEDAILLARAHVGRCDPLSDKEEHALRAELAELRRCKRALDDLNERAFHIRLVGGESIVAIDQGKKFCVIRCYDGTREDGSASLLEAVEQAREVSGG